MDFTTPRFVQDIDSKLTCNFVEAIDAQVDKGIGAGISGMFREKQTCRTPTSDRCEHWKAGFKRVLPFLLIAQACKPGDRSSCI